MLLEWIVAPWNVLSFECAKIGLSDGDRADWHCRVWSGRQFSSQNKCYQVSQNILVLNSSSIAPSLCKNSDFTHMDSILLHAAALSTVTRGNDVTRQSFKTKIDFFPLLALHPICSALPLHFICLPPQSCWCNSSQHCTWFLIASGVGVIRGILNYKSFYSSNFALGSGGEQQLPLTWLCESCTESGKLFYHFLLLSDLANQQNGFWLLSVTAVLRYAKKREQFPTSCNALATETTLHRQQGRSAAADGTCVNLVGYGLGSKSMQNCYQINITKKIVLNSWILQTDLIITIILKSCFWKINEEKKWDMLCSNIFYT